MSGSTIVLRQTVSRASGGAKAGSLLNIVPNRPSASRFLLVRYMPRSSAPCRPPFRRGMRDGWQLTADHRAR